MTSTNIDQVNQSIALPNSYRSLSNELNTATTGL